MQSWCNVANEQITSTGVYKEPSVLQQSAPLSLGHIHIERLACY